MQGTWKSIDRFEKSSHWFLYSEEKEISLGCADGKAKEFSRKRYLEFRLRNSDVQNWKQESSQFQERSKV